MVIPQMLLIYVYVHYKCICIIFLDQHEQSDLGQWHRGGGWWWRPPLCDNCHDHNHLVLWFLCQRESLWGLHLLWSKASLNPFLYTYNIARFAKNFQNIIGLWQKKITEALPLQTRNHKPLKLLIFSYYQNLIH